MRKSRHGTMIAMLCALSLALGCQGSPVAPTDEGRLGFDRGGRTARVKLAGRVFSMKARDGKPIADLSVMVRGKIYRTKNGRLDIPAAVLVEAKASGGLIVLVPGYLPARVGLDQDLDLQLVPLGPTTVQRGLTGAGGGVETADGTVEVAIPPGMLKAASTNVAISVYTPAPDGGVAGPGTGPGDGASGTGTAGGGTAGSGTAGSGSGGGATGGGAPQQEREGFLAIVDPPKAHGACDQPLPCPPPVGGIGVKLTFDGPLAPGKLTPSLRLDDLIATGGPDAAQAARRILTTFEAIDRLGDPDWRRILAERYGLTLRPDRTLVYEVALGDAAVRDGLAQIEVDGVSLLGTRLEVTVQSATQAGVPFDEFADPGAAGSISGPAGAGATSGPIGAASPAGGVAAGVLSVGEGLLITTGGRKIGPGSLLLSDLGGGLISNASGWVVSTGSGGVVSTGSGGIVSDMGGALISDQGAALISDKSGAVVSTGSGGMISNGSGNVVSTGSGGLISDKSGALVSDNLAGALVGDMRVPFSGPQAKYRLATYDESPWTGAQIRAIHGLGPAYTKYVPIGADGRYRLEFPDRRYSLNGLFLQVLAGDYRLYGLAAAPGKETYEEDVDAATTAVSSLLLDEIGRNPEGILAIDKAEYDQDVAYFRKELAQADAEYVVSHYTPAVATYVRAFLATRNRTLRCIPTVAPFAGAGAAGNADGALLAATFDRPGSLARDAAGRLYVCDTANNTIRRIDPAAGTVATVAGGNGGPAAPFDGTGPAARFGGLEGVIVGAGGDLIVSDTYGGGGAPPHRFRRVDAGGAVTTLGGAGPALTFSANPATVPTFFESLDVTADAAGNLYFVERLGHCITKLTATGPGTYAEAVLVGQRGARGDANGDAATARLNSPRGIAVDPAGKAIFVAEWATQAGGGYIHRIRKVDLTVAPTSPAFLTTYAGSDTPGQFGWADGLARAALFNLPTLLALDANGNLYVTEWFNHGVRRITPSGVVTTVLGGGSSGGENGNAVSVTFPQDLPIGGVAVDPAGKLYFSDRVRNKVKVLAPLK